MTLSMPVKIVALAGLALILGAGGVLLLAGHKATATTTPTIVVTRVAQKTHTAPAKLAVPKRKAPVKILPGVPKVIRQALAKHAVVVVAVYDSRNAVDRANLAEVRAGARMAHSGFVAANVANNQVALGVATWASDVADPATLIVKRPGIPAFVAAGPTDRESVAQAAAGAR